LDTMLGYIQNVTKNTYQKFTIQVHTPPNNVTPNPNWKGGGPGKGPSGGPWKGPTITRKHLTNYAVDAYTCPDAEMTTITGPDTTTNRVFCNTLRLLVEEDSNGPRSSSTYGMGGYSATLSKTLPFSPSGTLVAGPKFDRRGHRPGGPDKKPSSPTL
jgi:hypothetical protein